MEPIIAITLTFLSLHEEGCFQKRAFFYYVANDQDLSKYIARHNTVQTWLSA